MGTITLDAAIEASWQANRDLLAALESLTADDRVNDRLCISTALGALNYAMSNGQTPEARRRMESARRMCRAALGLEE